MESKILLLMMIVQISIVQCKYYRIHSAGPRDTCRFTGYIAGGNKVTVKRITAPTAKLQGNIMSTVMSKGGQASTLAMHSLNAAKAFGMLSKSFAAIAPALGPCLGVFGAVLGGLADMTKPTPADILKATNKAIAKLTDEVNNRLDEMKGYVDGKVITLEKTLIDKEYKTLFAFWANCIKERTYDLVNECQRDAAKYIIAAKAKFLVVANKDNVFNVKRLEASLLSFRDYAVLSVMCLKGLIDTYKVNKDSQEDSKFYYDRYLKELKEEVESFVTYGENSVKTIVDMHYRDGKGSCLSTFKCNGMHHIREGSWLLKVNTADWTECSCVIDPADVSTKTCKNRLTIRVDGATVYNRIYSSANSFYGAGQEYAKDLFRPITLKYLNSMKATIETYWQNEVLDLVPSWKGVAGINDVKVMDASKNLVQIVSDDPPSLSYSENYRVRLAIANAMANDFNNNNHNSNNYRNYDRYDSSMNSNNYHNYDRYDSSMNSNNYHNYDRYDSPMNSNNYRNYDRYDSPMNSNNYRNYDRYDSSMNRNNYRNYDRYDSPMSSNNYRNYDLYDSPMKDNN